MQIDTLSAGCIDSIRRVGIVAIFSDVVSARGLIPKKAILALANIVA